MNNLKENFSKIIKRRIAIVRSIIISLIILLIIIITFVIQNNHKENILMNILNRQQMLTQMISKYAQRKYIILKVLQSGFLAENEENLKDKIDFVNNSLKSSKEEFEDNLFLLKNGTLQNGNTIISFKDLLDDIKYTNLIDGIIWNNFSESVDILINSNEVNLETDEAILFINTNNEELLDKWNTVSQELMRYQKQKSSLYLYIAIIIFFIFLVLLFISIYQLNKYLAEPLNELYEGINNFGLLNKSINKSLSTKNELTQVIDEINSSFDKLNRLIELIENLNKDVSFDGILNYIYLSFSEFIPYSHIGIALLKDDGKTLEASYGISDSSISDLPKKLVGIKASIGKTSLEYIIKNGTPRVINDLDLYRKNESADYNKVLKQAGIKSSITLPLKINQKPVGIIFFSSIYKNIYKQEHITFLETLTNSISISLNKNIFIDELLYSTLLALAKMAEARDEDTGDHLDRMKKYTVKIVEFLQEDHIYDDLITIKFLKDIERFSPMHDIGKVGVRDGVLLKPEKLTDEEFKEMKKHTVYGAEVLRTAEGNIAKQSQSMFKMGIEIAEGHHEKWDGTGYPYNKLGTAIPLSARIVAIADVFDALTNKRPYKEAFSFVESFNIIVEGKGKHFDPNIIDSFVNHKDEIFELYMSFKK